MICQMLMVVFYLWTTKSPARMRRVARPRIELIIATTGKLGLGNDETVIKSLIYGKLGVGKDKNVTGMSLMIMATKGKLGNLK